LEESDPLALLEKISDDMKSAMKSRDQLRLETLRMIRAGLLEKQVEKRPSGGMSAEDEVAVLNSAAKKRKEAMTVYREKGREDLASVEEKELGIIQEYLPKQLSAGEIELVVKRIIDASGASSAADFGKVMPLVMKELKGKADGRTIQETVRKLLGN
jgi:uncharacterized protein YqeY